MPALEGVYSVLPTPFTAGDEVDLASLRRVIDLYLGAGVNGLTALGVTSEAARLSGVRHQPSLHGIECPAVETQPGGVVGQLLATAALGQTQQVADACEQRVREATEVRPLRGDSGDALESSRRMRWKEYPAA